jgi:hypothetical protein
MNFKLTIALTGILSIMTISSCSQHRDSNLATVTVKGLTMGGVWSLLEGTPGTVYTLTKLRGSKLFKVKTKTYDFLARVNKNGNL